MKVSQSLGRRKVLRGLGGITAGLPLLDCFLNTNGTALANGQPLPLVFGVWFWGCGLNPGRWEPKTTGKITELGPGLVALTPHIPKMNVYSGLSAYLSGKPILPHITGAQAVLAGSVQNNAASDQTIDQSVADAIGNRTRFRSLEAVCTGQAVHSESRRQGSASKNPGETSPVALYTRIFGPDFKDPNAAEFTPDPVTMVRRSVLSFVKDDRDRLMKVIGAADRARLDDYFTSLRQLEQQLDIQLQKPAPLEACVVPKNDGKEANEGDGAEISNSTTNHKLFATILTHAVACGQTQVFNLVFNAAISTLRESGSSQQHHELTHEEPIDPKLGYQAKVGFYQDRIMEQLAFMVATLDGFKEGGGSLLDRMILMAATEHAYAKVHGMDSIPLMTFGNAAGRMKTGYHMAAAGDTVARVGLTVQQALGMPVGSWGKDGNQTSAPFTEVVA